ncbi:uncharacterized protein LOC135102539 isoform X1 [Scylla paramamosain]|uniref:uncharacterized protein LOC135102539 isoform X1 n=1 Tax=Scylla paramamosain TaxID=85552 RepID=UPI003083148A
MSEGSRRGSVTDLLQCSVDLYVPPSPRHHPPPDPDCWGDSGRAAKHEKNKPADAVRSDPSSVSDIVKTAQSQVMGQRGEKLKVGEQTQNSSRVSDVKVSAHSKAETEVKAAKEKSKPGIKPRRPKPGSGLDQTKPRGAATEKGRPGAKSDKTSLQGHKATSKSVQGPDEDSSLPAPSKPRRAAMTGCSGAYQHAVKAVRGASPEGSVVMLGSVGEQEKPPSPTPAPNQNVNKLSFTIAMAATKMKSLCLRASPRSGHMQGSISIREDAETSSVSLTPSSLQSTKKTQRQRPGRKMFEDAYVITWSQPVLHADQADFRITFDKPKKSPEPPSASAVTSLALTQARVLRVRQSRRRSVGPEIVIPAPESEERDTTAVDWMEWRQTHDRVEQWLKDNAQTEPDESHVVAMLLDPDPRKGALYRT